MRRISLKVRLFEASIAGMPDTMSARTRRFGGQRPARTFLVVGLLFALFAVANISALTSWHAALVSHDDVAAEAATMVHGHDHGLDDGNIEAIGHPADKPDAPALDLHNLTHAMAHGLTGLVPGLDLAVPNFGRTDHWFAGRNFSLAGIAPEGLLRPPRN